LHQQLLPEEAAGSIGIELAPRPRTTERQHDKENAMHDFAGILIALGMCLISAFCQLFGLKRAESHRAEGIAIWCLGAALAFAGPCCILWGII
jgi:hypothetical protein